MIFDANQTPLGAKQMINKKILYAETKSSVTRLRLKTDADNSGIRHHRSETDYTLASTR